MDRIGKASVPTVTFFTACLLSLCSLTALHAAPAQTGSDAEKILAGYGRTNGLATVLSMADEVSAELALGLARAGIAVHVIVNQEQARAALVKAIGAKPGSDVVNVERLTLSSLPYLDNFINLLVIDDPKLPRKLGLTPQELERVVTPHGVIATRNRGEWKFSRKAWPAEMDNWTHPNYDASGNRCSDDKLAKPPFGYKWIDGLGIPIDRSLGCRGWVVSNGILFMVSGIEPENQGLLGAKLEKPEEFLTARDAFNGLILWKQRLGSPIERGLWSLIKGSALIKVAAIAVDEKAVYAVRNGKLTAFDRITGTEKFACPNEYLPWAVRVSGGAIITAGFGHGADSADGGVEAFDAATGAKRWSVAQSANNIIASTKVLFAQVKSDVADNDFIYGRDLTSGKELFKITGKDLGGYSPRLLSCGDDYLLINKHYATVCISPSDGKVLWQLDSVPYSWGPVVDGQLWVDGGAYDVRTGTKVKTIPKLLLGEGMTANDMGSEFGCVALGMVGNMVLSGRHHRYQIVEKDTIGLYYYRGMRAACGPSLTAANGMLMAPPVNCVCSPTHPYGFTTLAPVGTDPAAGEFITAPPVEKGPSFGKLNASAASSEWPMYRGNTERSAAAVVPSTYAFTQAWETSVIAPHDNGLLDDSRVSRTLAPLSPPVVGCGKVFVAVTDRGEVIAMDEKTGAESWRFRAGSRVETSPTIFGDGCFFGSNDGYVYALSAADGSLMWRARIAPRERRMMEHGIVESTWPVYGSVLAYRGLLFTSAGRNSESDGGVVIVALDPATGERKWSRYLDVVLFRKNDLLSVENGRIVWQTIDLDPLTGDGDLTKGRIKSLTLTDSRSGMWDNTLITSPMSRRVSAIYEVDGAKGWLMAWNDAHLVNDKGAVRRIGEKVEAPAPAARRRGPAFDIAVQPTAVVAGAKSAILGYSGDSQKKGRVTVHTVDGTETATIELSSGVLHNAIAVSRSGLALSLENGRIAFLKNAHLPPQNANYVQRVNCGGKEYKDSKGIVWSADQKYEPGKWGTVGGGGYDRTPDLAVLAEIVEKNGNVIRGMRKNVSGPDPYLYMTELSGMDGYRFTVPNGRYEVVLHFAETYYFNTMLFPNGDLGWVHRRFDVALNGSKVLDNFEPALEHNGVTHIPIMKKFTTDVADGDITVSFTALENNAILNAIEVIALPVEGTAGIESNTDVRTARME